MVDVSAASVRVTRLSSVACCTTPGVSLSHTPYRYSVVLELRSPSVSERPDPKVTSSPPLG